MLYLFSHVAMWWQRMLMTATSQPLLPYMCLLFVAFGRPVLRHSVLCVCDADTAAANWPRPCALPRYSTARPLPGAPTSHPRRRDGCILLHMYHVSVVHLSLLHATCRTAGAAAAGRKVPVPLCSCCAQTCARCSSPTVHPVPPLPANAVCEALHTL